MSKKHLFDDRVPTPELAANRYAAVAALNLTDPPHPVAHENFMKMIARVKAAAWDEGASDGQWNLEHEGQIERGTRQPITNPYRENGDNNE